MCSTWVFLSVGGRPTQTFSPPRYVSQSTNCTWTYVQCCRRASGPKTLARSRDLSPVWILAPSLKVLSDSIKYPQNIRYKFLIFSNFPSKIEPARSEPSRAGRFPNGSKKARGNTAYVLRQNEKFLVRSRVGGWVVRRLGRPTTEPNFLPAAVRMSDYILYKIVLGHMYCGRMKNFWSGRGSEVGWSGGREGRRSGGSSINLLIILYFLKKFFF